MTLRMKARAELERGCEFELQGDLVAAFRSFLKAARLRNVEAQVNVAVCYEYGKGCRKDFTKAVYWYQRAIRQRSPQAMYNFALYYRDRRKIHWAKFWLERAAAAGDQDAKKELSHLKLAIGGRESN